MHFLRLFECGQCSYYWQIPFGRPKLAICPRCGSKDVLFRLYDEQLDSEMLDPQLFS